MKGFKTVCKSRAVMYYRKTVLADGHKVTHSGFCAMLVRPNSSMRRSVVPTESGVLCIQVIV